MANNALTCYKIFGNREEISELYEKLLYLDNINRDHYAKYCTALKNNTTLPTPPAEISETSYHLWLGDIVTYFGGNNQKVRCRGTMDTIELISDEIIFIITDTAWYPMPEVWNLAIKDYPSLNYYYLSEECGCEIYINSDPTGEYFDALYNVDHMGIDTEDVASDRELFWCVAMYLEIYKIDSFEELDRLIAEYNEENSETIISYHKYVQP